MSTWMGVWSPKGRCDEMHEDTGGAAAGGGGAAGAASAAQQEQQDKQEQQQEEERDGWLAKASQSATHSGCTQHVQVSNTLAGLSSLGVCYA